MTLKIETVVPQFLFWEYLILGIGSLRCIHHLHKVKKGEHRHEDLENAAVLAKMRRNIFEQ